MSSFSDFSNGVLSNIIDSDRAHKGMFIDFFFFYHKTDFFLCIFTISQLWNHNENFICAHKLSVVDRLKSNTVTLSCRNE